jgi:hypothetical protein
MITSNGDAYIENVIYYLEWIVNLSKTKHLDLVLIVYGDHGAGAGHGGRPDYREQTEGYPTNSWVNDEEDPFLEIFKEEGIFGMFSIFKEEGIFGGLSYFLSGRRDEGLRTYGPEDNHEFKNTSNHLYDDEFAGLLNQIKCDKLVALIWGCSSAGMVEDCMDSIRFSNLSHNSLICSSKGEYETGSGPDPGYYYPFLKALGDGKSVQEAQQAGKESASKGPKRIHPKMHDTINESVYI